MTSNLKLSLINNLINIDWVSPYKYLYSYAKNSTNSKQINLQNIM